VSASPLGTDPRGIAITPDGTKAYVANQNANTVSVINTATNAVVGSAIGVGDGPLDIAICPAAVVPPTTPTDPAVVLKFTG
jgi:YVTN family beta-propeller protein